MHVVDLNEDHSSAASMRRNARHHATASPTHSVLTASEFGDPDRRGRSARIGSRARDDGPNGSLSISQRSCKLNENCWVVEVLFQTSCTRLYRDWLKSMHQVV